MRAATSGHCGISEPCWPQPPQPEDCLPCNNPADGQDQDQWCAAWETAASAVFDATCQRWTGACFSEIVRPCFDRCAGLGDCRCGYWQALNLAGMTCLPIRSVDVIVVDGAVWEQPTRIESLGWGGCMGGIGCGPFLVAEGSCPRFPPQTLNRRLSEPCTWAIIAAVGEDPPPHILLQTEKLAVQLIKADCGDETCVLPDSVQQMSRKGMTITLDNTRTGLPLLDKAIDKWCCHPADFETATDPSDTTTFHRQWLGHTDDLEDAVTALGMDAGVVLA